MILKLSLPVYIFPDSTTLSPLNFWPLTNISFAYDVKLGQDAKHPKKSHCPTSLEAGPPNFNFLAFLFDRTADSYVEVTTASGGDDGFSAVTLAFLLYLDPLTSGLILEYKAASSDEGLAITSPIPSSDYVEGLVLELQSGKPHAKVYGQQSLVSSVTSSVALTSGTWTWVAVRWNGDKGDLSVQVGSVITQQSLPSGTFSAQGSVRGEGEGDCIAHHTTGPEFREIVTYFNDLGQSFYDLHLSLFDLDLSVFALAAGVLLLGRPGSSSSTPIEVPRGTIQLGHYITHGSHTSFYGRLCCLGLFDSIVDVGSKESLLNNTAHPGNWQNKAPGIATLIMMNKTPVVKTGCSVGVASPWFYLWPLSNSSFGYDVINAVAPTAPANYQCLRSKAESTITNRSVVYADGSQLSYFDTTIMHSIFNEEMLLLEVFLQPDEPVEGVVWEYRIPTGQSEVGFQRMTLTLESGLPTVAVFDESGQCGSVVGREVVLPNIWTLVYLAVNQGVSKMVILTITGDTIGPSAVGPLTCPMAKKVPPSSGTLTVGSLSDLTLQAGTGDASYRGNMACLAITKETVDRTLIYPNLRTHCVHLDSLQLTEDLAVCDLSPSMREQKFVKVADDKSPQRQDPLECPLASSLIGCSNRCRGKQNCRAFTVRAADTACCLYDYVTQAGLQADTGSSYYAVTRF
ncbi:hypothetical protein ElyMa_000516300 [Elysia marginata]|uniref:Apple domain-containing protein n=1 Tax=Elysia marginata TaxID=1093978 RepID=A0AAV4FYD6_9GAST|nr:hypothetical protein ElyMa_000516300 [Elysia marginata]